MGEIMIYHSTWKILEIEVDASINYASKNEHNLQVTMRSGLIVTLITRLM